MEWYLILVGVIAFVWWVSARGENQRKVQERSARFAEVEREPEPRPKSPNEKLADSLESLSEAIREKTAADVQAMREQLQDANERLAAARQLADRLGISSAMTRIAEEMRHWPSWSKGDSFSNVLLKD